MQNTAFDLEVYVKHHQDRIRREITRAQQLDATRERHQISRVAPAGFLARLLAAARSWFSGRPAPATRALETKAQASDMSPAQIQAAAPARPAKPAPASNAYAGMVVIARASSVPIARQPSHAADC